MYPLIDYYESVGSAMAQHVMDETELLESPSHPSWISRLWDNLFLQPRSTLPESWEKICLDAAESH